MKQHLEKYLPVIGHIKNASLSDMKDDLIAGLAVGIVLIPQSMAYVTIAGLPPIYGLYASLIPLLIYPVFCSSRHLSIGPVAIDMIILAAGLGAVAGSGVQEKVALAVLLALLTGTLQILMSIFRLGFIFNLFSRPVISGFTSAAPVIIIFSQLEPALRTDLIDTQFFYLIFMDLLSKLDQVHWISFGFTALLILLLVISNKLSRRIPGLILVVGVVLVTGQFVDFTGYGIAVIGSIPKGLPTPSLPGFNPGLIIDLLPTALALGVVQFMTVAALSHSYSRKYGYVINPNRELFALGSSNLAGGFFKAPPVSASFSRSAIAEKANGKTPLTNIFAGLLVLLTLLLFAEYFSVLPVPLLAAIIMVSVVGLIDLKEIRFLLNTKRRDAFVAMTTFGAVLVVGIQEGILIGIVVSVLAILYKLAQPTVAELGLIPHSRVFRNVNRFEEAKVIPGILILRIDASFSFVNAQFFKNYILEKALSRTDRPEVVIIDGSTINDLDISAIDALKAIIETLNKSGIKLYISGLIGPVRDVLKASDTSLILNENRFFPSVHDAVEGALSRSEAKDGQGRLKAYRSQSN